VDRTKAETKDIIRFDAGNSTDTNSDMVNLTYSWDFGDGTTGTGSLVNHSYTETNTYTVSLTVTDDNNATDSTTMNLRITPSTSSEPDNNDADSSLSTTVIVGAVMGIVCVIIVILLLLFIIIKRRRSEESPEEPPQKPPLAPDLTQISGIPPAGVSGPAKINDILGKSTLPPDSPGVTKPTTDKPSLSLGQQRLPQQSLDAKSSVLAKPGEQPRLPPAKPNR
jgi:PKD repeat protein